MNQAEIWSQSEGSKWLDRNRDKLPKRDHPVVALAAHLCLSQPAILEVGCGNGWTLRALRTQYEGHRYYGIDPCHEAIAEARTIFPEGVFSYGTADQLMFADRMFGLVVYGFCLYQVDRSDLLRVVMQGDRVLAEYGYIIIYDFATEHPISVPYHHDDRLRTYKMDYAQLFLANPAYTLVRSVYSSATDTVASLIRKDTAKGWPEEEKCS